MFEIYWGSFFAGFFIGWLSLMFFAMCVAPEKYERYLQLKEKYGNG